MFLGTSDQMIWCLEIISKGAESGWCLKAVERNIVDIISVAAHMYLLGILCGRSSMLALPSLGVLEFEGSAP